jgi:hypothetical protein
MKRVPFFYYIMACLLSICITACDKEEQLIEDEIPEMIKADLSKRYPSVEILNYQEYSNFSQINVIDKDQNEASIWYVDDIWKMTHTKIADFNQLSLEAQTVFENSKYRFAQFENIYKTEREGMDRSLYTLHFLYQWKNVKDMTHYVCLNDDGMFLAVYTWTLPGLLICRRLILTLSIRNMTVLKLEDIRIMEDIMIILSFITTPLNLFLLEERLKLIIIFGKRQGMKSV